MHRLSFLLLSCVLGTNARSLLDAISSNPELSNFTAFYSANEEFANALYNNESNWPMTVLIPSNQAFVSYQQQYNTSLTSLTADQLLPLVQYHTLVSNLSGPDLATPDGLTIPTQLTSSAYNNRTAGPSLAAKYGGAQKASGQVVFISSSSSSTNTKKLLLSRQAGSGDPSIRSGLGSNVNLTAVSDASGLWDGGRYHIIDGLLTPPAPCHTTIRGAGLTSLDTALNRTSLWSALDHGTNLTCLGPSNAAFQRAGNPQTSLSEEGLNAALLMHTLPQVAYSDFLVDGQEFGSLGGGTVRVRVEGVGRERRVWFNNAEVVEANVLTNNGLMHVLDDVLKPVDQVNATSSTSVTASATASATSSGAAAASSSGGAVVMGAGAKSWSLLSALGMLMYLV
ncbi:FAS1 domain-containing protein [Polyplosphaeria fusca]|uniref:FAS1 domain-containing protein n=1 Tax=Polyplosphaeria fusca TaxID=682080 RepID=A0A9P4QXF1_9PLEO|nr:FAS1 domain-containing protein [Polyplosphaeria fusca]